MNGTVDWHSAFQLLIQNDKQQNKQAMNHLTSNPLQQVHECLNAWKERGATFGISQKKSVFSCWGYII